MSEKTRAKNEADDHRRILEERLLGIKSTDRDRVSPMSPVAGSLSAMALVMAGTDPLGEISGEEAQKNTIARCQSMPITGVTSP